MTADPASPDIFHVLLVTGISGAGKTTALKSLEDFGYEVVDNLPLGLVGRLVDPPGIRAAGHEALAIGVGFRTRGFDAELFARILMSLRQMANLELAVLYLDCDDDVLIRRFTETRHRHPLGEDRPVADSIRRERELSQVIVALADLVVDTSQLSIHDLRRRIEAEYRLASSCLMTVQALSFSFRQGVPRDADLVFDVRFLANPHYDEALRPLDGRDALVAAFIETDPACDAFALKVEDLLRLVLPLHRREGKSYLTIAFGCTGGRHRSVYMTERIAAALASEGDGVEIRHRDLAVVGKGEAKRP